MLTQAVSHLRHGSLAKKELPVRPREGKTIRVSPTRGWGGRGGGCQAGAGAQEVPRGRIRAHWHGQPCWLTCLGFSACMPVPAPPGTCGHRPFPSLTQKRAGVELPGRGVPWPDPIIAQSKPHPGSVTNSPLKTIRTRIPHSPSLIKHFHLFNNHCIVSGPGPRENSSNNSRHSSVLSMCQGHRLLGALCAFSYVTLSTSL